MSELLLRSSYRRMIALGLDPKKHLPDAGMDVTLINGVKVWVLPKQPKLIKSRSGMIHRVLCECPKCFKCFSAGRLDQHFKHVHK